MDISSFIFYLFAATLLLACLGVVLARNPLYNVLSLVLAIFSLSCLFISMEAYFVGIILLLVYAGAVLVFFLFVVMCLNLNNHNNNHNTKSRFSLLGWFLGLSLAFQAVLAAKSFMAVQAHGPSSVRGSIEAVGKILFTDYLLPFEMTSLLLLVAVFGIVSLAKGAFKS